MPKYLIPCYIPTTHEFKVVVEARDETEAANKLISMLESPDHVDYIESCINAGESEGIDNPVDFYRDVLTIKEITNEEAREFNLSLIPARFEEASDGC